MVFYRKYRPQKIDELDSVVVRENLTSIFSSKSSIHAFLFTGPKGLGKTSAARIVAKVINCTGRKTFEPDNKCEQCVSITNGTNLDVLEIDGASNRGIDEIRDLREKIKLAPFKAAKKVYIIDEVHMLTQEAFNALLKTLEEPPAHAVFILCTTEAQKVPETIASRCFRVNFERATNDEITRSLSRIVKSEKIKIDKDALLEIANLSDGSFRDGAKILEEVSVFAGRKTITKDLVNQKYNTLGIGQNVSQMLDALSAKDTKKALLICRQLAKDGMDFKYFIQALVERLHFLLLVEAGVEDSKEQPKLSLKEIQKLFELLSTAYQDTKFSILPQSPLEIAILDWAEMSGLGSLPRVEGDAQEDILKEKSDSSPSLSESRQSSSVLISKDTKSTFSSPSNGQTTESVFMKELIEEIKVHNNLFAGVLRGCKISSTDGKLTIIATSKFHKEKIEEEKNLKLLEQASEKITGKTLKISVMLGGESK